MISLKRDSSNIQPHGSEGIQSALIVIKLLYFLQLYFFLDQILYLLVLRYYMTIKKKDICIAQEKK